MRYGIAVAVRHRAILTQGRPPVAGPMSIVAKSLNRSNLALFIACLLAADASSTSPNFRNRSIVSGSALMDLLKTKSPGMRFANYPKPAHTAIRKNGQANVRHGTDGAELTRKPVHGIHTQLLVWK